MSGRRGFLTGLGAAGIAAGLRPLPALAAPAAVPVRTPVAPTALPPRWRNWSGLEQCQARAWQAPADEAALADTLRRGPAPLRCVGAGHSFSALVPSEGTLLSLDHFSGARAIDAAAATARFGAGTRLALVSQALHAQGLALHNLPDIDTQTLAGACATGTHGTGATLSALHAQIEALTLISARGERLACSRSERPELFAAAQVSLGALGVITEMTLRVRARHVLKRRVWLRPTAALLDEAPALAERHRHFECYLLPFTGYGAVIVHDEVSEAPAPRGHSADEDVLRDLRRLRDWAGRRPGLRRWLAAKLIDADQREEATDWSWRLLATVRPTLFNESEAHVPREAGINCLREVLAAIERRNEAYFPIEFRYVKGDEAWLSPFHRRDSCSIAVHAAHDEPWQYLVGELGVVFRRHGGRPHWGKLHDRSAAELAALYPRWRDFNALRRELDPDGRLLNPYLRRLFEGG
ncbi:FAD-binding protein [Aquincola sp. S2]|uniref:FAD-binding protein n=1 Tax=Pseudaquabacterium terrae TaxID=2732868 RepID=A0ABX2EAG5_9BURK|nr:D-arabinono-1,4-lactone oxidase [Aquabacterium terrae]NRF65508.1 FAD-binding protein [Aquabacterium terrae]